MEECSPCEPEPPAKRAKVDVEGSVLPGLRNRWTEVIASYLASGTKCVARLPEFKQLLTDCKAFGLAPCSSPICPHGGVRRLSEFPKTRWTCKTCSNGEWQKKTAAANAAHTKTVEADGVAEDSEVVLGLRVNWKEIVGRFMTSMTRQLGRFPEFVELQTKCSNLGFQVCASPVCPHDGVRSTAQFHPGDLKVCRTCTSGKGKSLMVAANAAHNARINAAELDDLSNPDLAAFRARWAAVIAAFKASDMKKVGDFAAFKTLNAECAGKEFGTCASLTCPHSGVRHLAYFPQASRRLCQTCMASGDTGTANASHKVAVLEREGKKSAPLVAIHVETEAMNWLKQTLEGWFPGIEVVVMPEFRQADFAVRFPEWEVNRYLPVQLKSDGAYKRDGSLKPNNSNAERGNRGTASFHSCTGYAGMLVMFVKTRLDFTDTCHRTLWWAWGEQIKGTNRGVCFEAATSALLCNINPAASPWTLSSAPPALLQLLQTPDPARRRLMRELWLDVRDVCQRKEMAGMLALEQVSDVAYLPGNQTAIDCHFGGRATQVKTYMIKHKVADASHVVKGRSAQPYSSTDGIEQLVEVAIVKSGERFYLLYAMQLKDDLVSHGVFAHDGVPGKSCINVPLGPYAPWLIGEDAPVPRRKAVKWLVGPEHGFRPPVRLQETMYLTRALLEEVAWTAARPDLMPD